MSVWASDDGDVLLTKGVRLISALSFPQERCPLLSSIHLLIIIDLCGTSYRLAQPLTHLPTEHRPSWYIAVKTVMSRVSK